MPHGASVATKAAISLLDDTTLQDKTPKLCPENGTFYYLDKTSTEVVDSELVLATNSGTGRWHKVGGAGGYTIQATPPDAAAVYTAGTVIIDTFNGQICYYLGHNGTWGEWLVLLGNIQTFS